MYCPQCGTPHEPGAMFCVRCGANLAAPAPPPASVPPPASAPPPMEPSGVEDGESAVSTPRRTDDGVGALGVLFFCLPLVGAIMYFVWRDDQPRKARQACTLALLGVAIGIVLRVLMTMAQSM